jgi:putative hemolysin
MLARAYDASNSPFLTPAAAPAPTEAPAPVDAEVFPHHPDLIPPGIVSAGSYDMRFAWTRADLHAVQALRYAVFNEELGEGLASAEATGRDEDPRDPWFHHLLIVHRATDRVVGTYRLQTAIMAATRHGFYSASLFELGAIPGSILGEAVEIGRACVHPAHRSGRVLHLLWRGLARYLTWNSKRYLFGCCSIPGVDGTVAQDAWRAVHARGVLHDRLLVRPRPAVSALPDDGRARPLIDAASLTRPLPPLFEGYLTLGARVCGAPAFDREFGTTDFLVLLDVEAMPPRAHQTFFA